MKRLLSLLISLTIFSGCDTKDAGNPKAVADKFIDAASRNDVPAMKDLSTIESRFALNFIDSSESMGSTKRTLFEREKVQTGEATIVGDQATVPVTFKNSGESVNLPLKKQLGQWKVSLDMSTLKQIVSSKAQESRLRLNDALRKMGNINIDSLSSKVRVNGKSLDSMRNEFKRRGLSLDSLKKRKIDINF